MATHSSVLARRIPGTGEPGGLPSMGLHRVGHDWSDLAAAVAAGVFNGRYYAIYIFHKNTSFMRIRIFVLYYFLCTEGIIRYLFFFFLYLIHFILWVFDCFLFRRFIILFSFFLRAAVCSQRWSLGVRPWKWISGTLELGSLSPNLLTNTMPWIVSLSTPG